MYLIGRLPVQIAPREIVAVAAATLAICVPGHALPLAARQQAARGGRAAAYMRRGGMNPPTSPPAEGDVGRRPRRGEAAPSVAWTRPRLRPLTAWSPPERGGMESPPRAPGGWGRGTSTPARAKPRLLLLGPGRSRGLWRWGRRRAWGMLSPHPPRAAGRALPEKCPGRAISRAGRGILEQLFFLSARPLSSDLVPAIEVANPHEASNSGDADFRGYRHDLDLRFGIDDHLTLSSDGDVPGNRLRRPTSFKAQRSAIVDNNHVLEVSPRDEGQGKKTSWVRLKEPDPSGVFIPLDCPDKKFRECTSHSGNCSAVTPRRLTCPWSPVRGVGRRRRWVLPRRDVIDRDGGQLRHS